MKTYAQQAEEAKGPKDWQTYEQEYNEDGTIHCEKCGTDYREGDYPFCKGVAANHGTMHGFDEGFTPYIDVQLLDKSDPRCTEVNHLGMRGVMINSRSERRQIMKEKELQFGSQKFEDRGKKLYFT